jgi:hypothetical protein
MTASDALKFLNEVGLNDKLEVEVGEGNYLPLVDAFVRPETGTVCFKAETP